MAIETLFKGASIVKKITFTMTETDGNGNESIIPIPHAEIIDVRVILKVQGTTVHKFSTNATDIAGDFEELTTEGDEGTFSFNLTPAQTAVLPVGIMSIEVSRFLNTAQQANFQKITEHKLFNIRSSESQNLQA